MAGSSNWAAEIQDFLSPYANNDNLVVRLNGGVPERSRKIVPRRNHTRLIVDYQHPPQSRRDSTTSSEATRSTGRSTACNSSTSGSSYETPSSTAPTSTAPSLGVVRSTISDVIARQTGINSEPELPCEFAGYDRCDQMFQLDETEQWIRHTVNHLHGQLPAFCICWFCDDFKFDANEGGLDGDRQTNFENRMRHIHQHFFDEGRDAAEIRPDFFFLDHLHLCGLVSNPMDHRARCRQEGPMAKVHGIYPPDFVPPERKKETERNSQVVFDQKKEDRMRRRRGHGSQTHTKRP